MPEGIGNTLSTRAGPLPVWAWAGLGTALLGGYLYYRRKQAASTAAAQASQGLSGTGSSSDLGTVPISNLTTAAQPMPIQMGDTFVDTSQSQSQTAGAAAAVGGPATVTGTATSSSGTGQSGSTSATSTSSASSAPPPVTKVAPPKPPATVLKAAPKPTPAPPKTQTMTVCKWPGWCGSLWGIAQHYYGNGALWTSIYNANKAKIGSNPNLIYAGTTLIIPPKPA